MSLFRKYCSSQKWRWWIGRFLPLHPLLDMYEDSKIYICTYVSRKNKIYKSIIRHKLRPTNEILIFQKNYGILNHLLVQNDEGFLIDLLLVDFSLLTSTHYLSLKFRDTL